MTFFTLTKNPAPGQKCLKTDEGLLLVEQEYTPEQTQEFLTEAERWCVRTFLHYYHEDLSYNDVESFETIEYMPIMPREIVIEDGAVVAFIRHTGRYAPYGRGRVTDLSLLMTDPAKRTRLRNIIDSHTSENYDTNIYYVYTLHLRSELAPGETVNPTRNELMMDVL